MTSSTAISSLPVWRRFIRKNLLNLPVAVVESARDLSDRVGVTYHRLDETQEFTRSDPRTGHPEMIAVYRALAERARLQPETYVVTLHHGRVHNERGFIVTADGVLVHELSRHHGMQRPTEHRFMQRARWGGITKRLAGRAAAVMSDGAGIYYHWLMDLLPRAHLLALADRPLEAYDRFIVPANRIRAGDGILTRLGIPPEKIVEASRFVGYQADELVVPSYASRPLQPNPVAVAILREEIRPRITSATGGKPRRLYIRRTARRRLLNQDAIEAVLARFGFETVQSERLSIAEQWALFSEAEMVAGVHGAGLANSVFAPPGAALIELTVPDYAHFCFWDLASAANLRLYSVFGTGDYPAVATDPRADVHIDPVTLARTLDQAVAESPLH